MDWQYGFPHKIVIQDKTKYYCIDFLCEHKDVFATFYFYQDDIEPLLIFDTTFLCHHCSSLCSTDSYFLYFKHIFKLGGRQALLKYILENYKNQIIE